MKTREGVSLMRIIFIFFISIVVAGCSNVSTETSLEQTIFNEYIDNNRVEKYEELVAEYGKISILLWFNSEHDAFPLLNTFIWLIFSIMPDAPDVLAGGGILAIIYAIAWWLGVSLTGGGILGVLAYIGNKIGVAWGVAPAIMGILYLGLMFSILVKLFGLVL